MLKYDLIGKYLYRIKIKPIYGFIGALVIFGVTESIIIPILGHYTSLSALEPKDLWVRLAAILTNFFVSPVGWAYYISILNTPDDVVSDLQSKKIVPIKAKRDFIKWRLDYENDLGSKYAALIVYLIPTLITAIVVKAWLFDYAPWFGRNNPLHFVFASTTTFLQWYVYAWILVRELITIRWIAKLFNNFQNYLILYPSHPDRAGGLSIIGRHVNRLIAFVVILGLQYSFYTYFAILNKIPYNITSFAFILGWLAYFIVVPLSFFPFVIPTHRFMKEYKQLKLSKITQMMARIADQIEKQYNNRNTKTTQELITKLENLKRYFDFVDKELPVWPFDASTFGQISISSLIPILNFTGSFLLNHYVK
jgi:hypothetical protein